MAVHPARRVSYEELESALEDRVRRGALASTDDGPLRLYIYTNRCVYEQMWDDVTELGRGLVLDRAARRVRATPFPKFFNYGERGLAVPDEPFEAYEKLDGSLVIVFHDGKRFRAVTKGAFDSAQARCALGWIEGRGLTSHLRAGATYLFEAIFPQNRIVVRYDWQGLVLLGAYAEDGKELGRAELIEQAGELGVAVVAASPHPTLRALIDACETMTRDQEGFVLRFASGLRLKLKGAAYRRIHALISDVTPLGLWRVMEAGEDIESTRREIPEEYWGDFDRIRAALAARLDAVRARVEEAHARHAHLDDRALGLALARIDPDVAPYLFTRRKKGGGWIEDPRARRSLFRQVRPDGNAMEGYRPSTVLMGAQAEG